jgi:DNA-binding NarL/FixJ family response regulator
VGLLDAGLPRSPLASMGHLPPMPVRNLARTVPMTFRQAIAPPGTPLTRREREVVEAYRKRGSYDGAAEELGISVSTVREHLASARSRRRVRKTWQIFDAV